MTPLYERHKKYRDKNLEQYRATWTKWSRTFEGTITVLLSYARDRSRRQNVAFSLDREFVRSKLAAGVCEFSGLPIVRAEPGCYRTHPFAPSLDRIVPNKGYTKDNVRLVAFCVNRARSDFGDEILLKMARALVENNKVKKLKLIKEIRS